MKMLTLIALLLVTGCTTVNTAQKYNPQCHNVGVFASGIADLRETGITQEQVEFYISKPTVQTFPVTMIRKQVYAAKWTRAQAYNEYYGKCVAVGYTQLLNIMQDEEQLGRLVNENATLISRVSTLQRKASEQPTTIVVVREPPPAPVKAYGAPIGDVIVR